MDWYVTRVVRQAIIIKNLSKCFMSANHFHSWRDGTFEKSFPHNLHKKDGQVSPRIAGNWTLVVRGSYLMACVTRLRVTVRMPKRTSTISVPAQTLHLSWASVMVRCRVFHWPDLNTAPKPRPLCLRLLRGTYLPGIGRPFVYWAAWRARCLWTINKWAMIHKKLSSGH